METQVSQKPRREPVYQLSIFADNKVGRLNDVLQRLAEAQIHIMAISLLDTTECTIMRFIVDDYEGARELLNQLGYAYTTTEIIVVEINTEADIRFITAALVEAETNIHYVYSFVMRPKEKSALALSLEDNDIACSVLESRGHKVLDASDIYR